MPYPKGGNTETQTEVAVHRDHLCLELSGEAVSRNSLERNNLSEALRTPS